MGEEEKIVYSEDFNRFINLFEDCKLHTEKLENILPIHPDVRTLDYKVDLKKVIQNYHKELGELVFNKLVEEDEKFLEDITKYFIHYVDRNIPD